MNPDKIFSSIYQDVYRIHSGVLVLVNKFSTVKFPVFGVKIKRYYNSKYLRVLDEDYKDSITGKIYPKGTVLYNDCPVRIVERPMWLYELKLSSGACVGNSKDFKQFADIIENIVNGKYD